MSASLGNRISVCLLTYNHVDVIDSTLESILDQTITGYEVIVSDDCSSDGTWERILSFAEKDKRIKAVRTPRNMGMPGNANFAVAQSVRPYIALLHHDDLYRKDLLEKWGEVLDRHAGISFVFNRYLVGTLEPPWPPPFNEEQLNGHWFLKNFLFARWGCPVRGTAMIRKAWWDQVGGIQEKYDLVADVDLWMRLAAVSQVGYVSEPLISVRALRPEYYPDIYTGKQWHWPRLVLVYEIHASNRLNYLPLNTLKGKLEWLCFRLKLSCETAKWLFYAVAKRKYDMVGSSSESVTRYDLWPLRILRWLLQKAISPVGQLSE